MAARGDLKVAGDQVIGSVVRLWMFPVKSMKGERVEAADVGKHGIAGDRAYALLDVETGKIVSAKNVRLFPDIFGCQASFIDRPRPGENLPPVRIALPEGRSTTSESPDADLVLSEFFKREVRIVRQAPEDFIIDMYHPDVADADPAGYRDTVVEQKVGSAYWQDAGVASPIPQGSFLDLFPVSVLTTATLDQMNKLQPGSRFDERRFRMNVIVETPQTGFIENDWVGRDLVLGDSLRLGIELPDPRCVMTTLAQDELPRDTNILRGLVQHNRIDVGEDGRFPCAGVYAVVRVPGVVRAGDSARLV